MKIIEPKSAAMNIRVILCVQCAPFGIGFACSI